jgi:hypothetical protein
MARVRRMRTQETQYWQEEYQVSEADLDYLTGIVLESGRPRSLEDLVSSLMVRHIQREKDRAAEQVSDGDMYRPVDTHEVGQVLVFSEMDFARGTVTDVRQGRNPSYESFDVIRVNMEETGEEREFASAFEYDHLLNRPVEELVGGTDEILSEAQIIEANADVVSDKLAAALETREEWVRFNGTWFLEALLPEVNVGHLNLAEAVIYEAGHPVPAQEMLHVTELDQGASREATLFALNLALGQDERFDNVARDERQIWYLRALMPAEVFERPVVSRTPFAATGEEEIGLTMLDIVEELGDELDSIAQTRTRDTASIGFQLNFPHLYAGTMPATRELLSHFDYAPGRHFGVRLVAEGSGRIYDGWVVPEEKYVAGLADWYQAAGLVVGSIITVAHGDEPMSLVLSTATRRGGGSEWLRRASVEDGELSIQLQPASIRVRYDPDTLVDVTDREAVARLMWQSHQTSLGLGNVVRTVVLELAKLSPQGAAHCKTIYSAVNMYRRSGAVPIFAILTRNACFDPVGLGEWAYDASLEGKVYRTPDEMRERPLSKRSALFRDQAVRYAGS